MTAACTQTGPARRRVAVPGILIEISPAIWFGANCPEGVPLQGRYLAIRTGYA